MPKSICMRIFNINLLLMINNSYYTNLDSLSNNDKHIHLISNRLLIDTTTVQPLVAI